MVQRHRKGVGPGALGLLLFMLVTLGASLLTVQRAGKPATRTPPGSPLPPRAPQEILPAPPAEVEGYEEAEGLFGGYIGVQDGRIAIFRGRPPNGTLEHVTEFEVKEDVREQLERGIPFTTTEELLQLLESYTS